jgi:hypothetical protein
MNAYEYGVKRGRATGRGEATQRDYDWIADETDGEIQCTDPQDAVDFGAGMRAGAAEPDPT